LETFINPEFLQQQEMFPGAIHPNNSEIKNGQVSQNGCYQSQFSKRINATCGWGFIYITGNKQSGCSWKASDSFLKESAHMNPFFKYLIGKVWFRTQVSTRDFIISLGRWSCHSDSWLPSHSNPL
jgi:hypothetical protein